MAGDRLDFTLVYPSGPGRSFEVALGEGQTGPCGLLCGHPAVPAEEAEHRKFGGAVGRFFFVADPDGHQI